MGEAHAVVIAAPLTPETEGLLGAAELAACGDGCDIVNVGRAEIVVEHAMWKEVSSGRLSYASDVWWREPGKSIQAQGSKKDTKGTQGTQGRNSIALKVAQKRPRKWP